MKLTEVGYRTVSFFTPEEKDSHEGREVREREKKTAEAVEPNVTVQ